VVNAYLKNINKKETNELLVSLKAFAIKNSVPIITDEGLSFINQIIKLSKSKNILEIGSAIGYSSISMAMSNNVSITTIEKDKNMYEKAVKNIEKASLNSIVNIINCDALELDETTLDYFDLIFIDAAKAQSAKFFTKYKTQLKPGGIIITDNLLFHGLVNTEVKDRNLRQLLRKINDFNEFVVNQSDFDTYIYQLGDGMSLSIKKG